MRIKVRENLPVDLGAGAAVVVAAEIASLEHQLNELTNFQGSLPPHPVPCIFLWWEQEAKTRRC
jgi:hypothetical protein